MLPISVRAQTEMDLKKGMDRSEAIKAAKAESKK
jgi:hypothetical protein